MRVDVGGDGVDEIGDDGEVVGADVDGVVGADPDAQAGEMVAPGGPPEAGIMGALSLAGEEGQGRVVGRGVAAKPGSRRCFGLGHVGRYMHNAHRAILPPHPTGVQGNRSGAALKRIATGCHPPCPLTFPSCRSGASGHPVQRPDPTSPRSSVDRASVS